MFLYNQIFSRLPERSLFNLITASSIVRIRRMFFHLRGGVPEFFHEAKGRGPKNGGQNIFTYAKEGPEKIGDRPSQTDAPLPVKNDSSLSFVSCHIFGRTPTSLQWKNTRVWKKWNKYNLWELKTDHLFIFRVFFSFGRGQNLPSLWRSRNKQLISDGLITYAC